MKQFLHSLIFLLFVTGAASGKGWFGQADPWEQFEPPADSRYDWLQLTSGEWLKGKLDMIYNDTVEFNSDEFDDQIFELEDVKRIRTCGKQRVRIEKSRIHFSSFRDYRAGNLIKSVEVVEKVGMVELNGDDLRITDGDEDMLIHRNQIITVVRKADQELDRWSGEISINVTAASGNSERLDTVTRIGVKRRTARSLVKFDYTGNYSVAFDETLAENQRLNVAYDLFVTSRTYLQIVGGEVLSNPISNIRLQYSVSTGAGYYLINTTKTKWRTGLGGGYQKTDYKTVLPGEPGDSSSPFLGFLTVFDMEVTSEIDFYYEYTMRWLNEESGLYTHFMLATLSFELTEDLDLDFGLSWDRIQEPTIDADGLLPEQDDYKLTVGLSYEF